MKKTIELVYEQVDAIVVAELQESYDMNYNMIMDGQATPDVVRLLGSIEDVLRYFMNSLDFELWISGYENRN
jgi:hypothetical protein